MKKINEEALSKIDSHESKYTIELDLDLENQETNRKIERELESSRNLRTQDLKNKMFWKKVQPILIVIAGVIIFVIAIFVVFVIFPHSEMEPPNNDYTFLMQYSRGFVSSLGPAGITLFGVVMTTIINRFFTYRKDR